jgi:FtsP/CotA-like multicopper oxidase with cupredoxin domain
MAAGYVLQDPTEQSLVYDAINNPTGVLPPLADTIPLVIQEKTFVPDKTQPVLNFYGPFASQLQSQDPTWRWGTTNAAPALNGNGDLWVPHVFMPNQNPGDVSGANAVGRWDYGPWFWPPFTQIVNSGIKNPYYDPSCNTTVSYCENQFIPGVPNGSLINVSSNGVSGGVLDKTTGKVTESPSGTPEAFNDTAMVNGTAYPYISVDPKKYRLRMLSVGNDRMLNLSLVVAASKNSVDTTAAGNAGTANSTILCDGTTNVAQADCTEVKMVPFNDAQNIAKPFPGHWYTRQKGGVTFDGRPSGVFDPATRGPEMVQIGTEGGFLSSPVEIKNQPVNYEYNPKNILIGNVKEKALFLGPAERADVLVDFSNFAGATLILYNDAPAPNPAWDLRLDYYTGNFDNTDTGGAFSVVPGYGPNSRTLMQIRVSTNGGTNTHPVDDLGNIDLPALTTAVQTAFKTSQEPIIVPQSVYSATYGMAFADALGADLSRISDNWLTYSPLSLPDANGDFTLLPPVKLELEPKSIIEDWTQNWGRMNALLGTEVPHTSATLQTSIPQAFVDPPTDLVKITPNDNMVPISGTAPDGTQLWKITHNGVDSHAIHFHLFHVQIVNRVGWDGAIYAPDANELGWKDTVRMNPLSDTIVALRPMTMKALPFKVPNSHRLLNPALAVNATSADFFNLDPISGNASTVTNQSVNYGWEYLWHCHILGHEENDMMRTIAVAQPPEAPSALTLTPLGAGGMKLDWTDNSIISNWVKIQRSTSPVFATIDATFDVVQAECDSQAGCVRTYTDTTAKGGLVYYRIMANNTVGGGDGQLDAPRNPDGSYGGILPASLSSLTPGFTGYANVTGNSNWTTASGEFPKTPAFNAFLFPTPPVTVSMTWTASSVNPAQPDSYQVRRTAAGNANLNCATAAYTNLGVATTALTATDTTIAVNRSYCYKVVATNAVGSFTSAPVKITPPAAPAAPTILTITNATPTGLTLGWQETVNLPVPTGFEIQRCSGLTASGNCGAAGAGWTSLGTVAAVNGLGSYSYNVTGLISGTPYLFRVRAFDPVTSAFVTSAAVAYPVAIVNTATVIANTTAAQNISAGNVLTNDLPSGPAASKTVTNLTGAIHTGGSLPVTVGAVTVTPLPATATVTCTTAGVCSLTLTSPAANTVTGNPNGITNAQQTTLNNQLRQASKRGTYTFDYTETYTTNYGTFTSAPVTVTVTVN